MTLVVTHSFVSTVTDLGTTGIVGPNAWNANHVVSGTLPFTSITGQVTLAQLPNISDSTFLANVSGTGAPPSAATISQFLDHVFTSNTGAIIYSTGTSWSFLPAGNTAGYYLQTGSTSAPPSWTVPGGGAGAGNPTNSVGTSVINGSAATFMRSDAAPQINQGMAPTWTALHTFKPGLNNIGILGSGNTTGLRLFDGGINWNIEGVDQTGVGSYQNLAVGGLNVILTSAGTPYAILTSLGRFGVGNNFANGSQTVFHEFDAEYNAGSITGNEGATHCFGFLSGQTNSDYILYGGVDRTNSTAYLQGVQWGVAVAPIVLNYRGGAVGVGTIPKSLFHVYAGNALVQNTSGNNAGITVLGVNTTGNNDSAYYLLSDYNSANTAWIGLTAVGAGGNSGSMRFMTGGTERGRFDNSSGGFSVGSVNQDFGLAWTGVFRKDQNTATYLGVINNQSNTNVSCQFRMITATANSFIYYNLLDNNGAPTAQLGGGIGVSELFYAFPQHRFFNAPETVEYAHFNTSGLDVFGQYINFGGTDGTTGFGFRNNTGFSLQFKPNSATSTSWVDIGATYVDAVTRFNFIGDGATDNSTAWSNLAAYANTAGGTFFFRPGVYVYATGATFTGAGINIIGSGSYCSVSANTANAPFGTVFRVTNSTNPTFILNATLYFGIEKIMFWPTVWKSTNSAEIYIENGSYTSHIRDCAFYECSQGVDTSGVAGGLLVDNCTFRYFVGNYAVNAKGINSTTGFTQTIYLTDVVCDNPATGTPTPGVGESNWATSTNYNTGQMVIANGIVWQALNTGTSSSTGTGPQPNFTTADSAFTNSVADGTVHWQFCCSSSLAWFLIDSYSATLGVKHSAFIHGFRGVLMQDSVGASGSLPKWLTCTDLQCDHQIDHAVLLSGGEGFFSNNGWWGSSYFGSGLEVLSTFSGEISVQGGRIFGNALHGINVQGNTAGINQYISITDVMIGANGQATANTFSGISMTNTTYGFVIHGCHIGTLVDGGTNQQQYGIIIGTDCNDFIVTENIALGNSTAGYNNGANTSASKIFINNI